MTTTRPPGPEVPPPGTGYFVTPDDGSGPAVLLLASSWGLTRSIKARADELSQAGFTVLAPDLNEGVVADTPDQATEALMTMDINVAASLTQSSLRLVQAASVDPVKPAAIVGFGSGASWALWLSVRLAPACRAVVGFYGTQSIEFDDSASAYLLHFGSDDDTVSDDEVAVLGLNLQLARRPFTVERHERAGHGFAEAEHPNFDAAVESIAWRQSLEFLAQNLRPSG